MRSMRDIMTLLEGHDFPAVNNDELVGKIMSLMGILSGMGFSFNAEWVSDVMAKVKQQKLECEHDEAGERLKAETEGEPEADDEERVEEGEESPEPAEPESGFDAKEAFLETADTVFASVSHASSVLADVVTAERTYKDGKVVDPDNLGQEVDESDYLTCMDAQRDLVAAFESVKPSKPSTYRAVIDGVDAVLAVISKDKSDDKPEFVAAVKAELESLLPLMRFSLTVRSGAQPSPGGGDVPAFGGQAGEP